MGAWYKDFYLLNPEGISQIKAALADPVSGADARADIQKRIDEMKQLDDDRCHISREQKRVLEGILNAEPESV